jgi:prophage regulatory protein
MGTSRANTRKHAPMFGKPIAESLNLSPLSHPPETEPMNAATSISQDPHPVRKQPGARKEPPQPLSILNQPNALLKIRTVTAVVGLSDSSVRKLIREGSFPKPIRFGQRCSRWRSADINRWLQAAGLAAEGADK